MNSMTNRLRDEVALGGNEIQDIILKLCSADIGLIKDTITAHFHPTSRLVHPFLVVNGRDDVYNLYKCLNFFLDARPIIHNTYTASGGDVLVDMTQTLALWWLPFFRIQLPVQVAVTLGTFRGRSVIIEQRDHVDVHLLFWLNPIVKTLHQRVYLPFTSAMSSVFFPATSSALDWLESLWINDGASLGESAGRAKSQEVVAGSEQWILLVIGKLLSGNAQLVREATDADFHPEARVVFPLGEVDGRQNIYHVYRTLTTLADPRPLIHQIYFAKDGDISVDMTMTVAPRLLPVVRLVMGRAVIAVRLAQLQGRKMIIEQYDHIDIRAVFWCNPVLRLLYLHVYLPLTTMVFSRLLLPIASQAVDWLSAVLGTEQALGQFADQM